MRIIIILLMLSACKYSSKKNEVEKKGNLLLDSNKIDSLSNQIDTLFPDYDRGEIDSENNQFNTIKPIEEYSKRKYKNIDIIVSGYDTSYTIEKK